EPVTPVRVRGQVVRRVEAHPHVRIGDAGDGAVVLVPHDPAPGVFARNLTALKIERVSVTVVRRAPEHGDAAIVLQPAELPVVRDVAPDQILALTAPCRSFGPHGAGPETVDRRVVDA